MPLNAVLVCPDIPQNTGNIVRTCAATGTVLHLVRPLGFSLEESRVRRAGLDYWSEATILVHDSLEAFLEGGPEPLLLFSTRGGRAYSEAPYTENGYLVFGSETRGLPGFFLNSDERRVFRLPMRPGTRSLNLSNAVAVVIYEALRSLGFPGLVPGR